MIPALKYGDRFGMFGGTKACGKHTGKQTTYYEVKRDNRLFVVKGQGAKERLHDMRKNTPDRVFKRVGEIHVAFKRIHDPYQEEIVL